MKKAKHAIANKIQKNKHPPDDNSLAAASAARKSKEKQKQAKVKKKNGKIIKWI